MKKKILFLVNHDIVIYNFRKELVEKLLQEGYEIIISSPYGERIELLKNMGCEFIETPVDRRSINPIKDMILIHNYYNLIKKVKPECVLTYTIKPNIYGSFICSFLKTKFICNITGLGSTFQKKGLISNFVFILYKLGVKQANWVFTQNESIASFLKNNDLITNKSSVLPGSGVSLEKFQFSPLENNDEYRFLFVGRIMREKGVIELLEAANQIIKKYDNVHFDLVGMMDDNINIKKYINDQITYHGDTLNIIPFYKKSTCLIHPSYHEGMSNVTLEACAIGRPCLVSNIPGCKEIVVDGYNGYLFEPKSSQEIIDTIIKFISLENKKIIDMGNNSRNIVEKKFDRNIIVNAYLNKIKEME